MAIKSRGRARGRRAVAAAPRRPLVVRKPPIWRRPWVWVVVGVLAAGGIAFGTLSILHSHSVAARKNREKLAVTNLFNQFKAALPADRRAVPPDVLVIFPTVNDDLAKIGKDIKGDDVKKRGKDITDAAQKSVTALQAIKDRVNRILPAEFAGDRAGVGRPPESGPEGADRPGHRPDPRGRGPVRRGLPEDPAHGRPARGTAYHPRQRAGDPRRAVPVDRAIGESLSHPD